ncbi:MAG: response regulator [Anaerolineales bacterium]|nr:response regulator [Anaerolineales bacterium]
MTVDSNSSRPTKENAPVCILVVDDHPNSAAMLARVIGQLGPGVTPLSAESAEEALSVINSRRVDLLITDLVMPGVTGLDLIERLQKLPGRRPAYTILMTAYNVPGLKEIAKRLMVNEIVSKPIQPERMCRMIIEAIEVCGFNPVLPENGGLRQTDAPGGGRTGSESPARLPE